MNTQKILLLDDNRDLLQIIQIILKGQGYETIVAATIEEAEQKIRIHQPVLIMMDVFLSDQDGCGFCRQLKADPESAGIRIIMMSGNDSMANECREVGADDFMVKPFDFNDLLTRVNKQMEHMQPAGVGY